LGSSGATLSDSVSRNEGRVLPAIISPNSRGERFAKFDVLFQQKLTGAVWGYLENKPMPSLRADDAASS
jgi:hypothetical protein